MDALTTQIHFLASTADEAGRKQIIEQLRDLSFSLEQPADVVQRLAHRHLEIAMVRVGIDLRIFELLAEKEGEVGLDELVRETGAGRGLVGVYFRFWLIGCRGHTLRCVLMFVGGSQDFEISVEHGLDC